MQGAALVVSEVVTLVVRHEVDNRPLGQSGRLVENKPPLFDTGSERAHVATVRVSSMPGKRSRHATEPLDLLKPPTKYPSSPLAGYQFISGLQERIGRLPGVESAGLAANHPLDTGFTNSFTIVGREAEAKAWPEISTRFVTPGYFRTLRLSLLHGRFLSDSDEASSLPVVVVNRATMERFFAGQDPIGRKLQFWGTERTIVGVVGDGGSPGPRVLAHLA